MVKIRLNVIADLSRVLNVSRYSKSNQLTLLQTAASRYLQYLKNRFIRLSAGGGEWPKLKRITIQSKKKRGASNPRAILREFNELFGAIKARRLGSKIYAGYVRNEPHTRSKSVFFLAKVHTKGTPSKSGRIVRKVVGLPDTKTRKKMVEDIRNTYNRIIRPRR